MAHSAKRLLISGALLVACSTQDTEPGSDLLDAATEASVPLPEAEASTNPSPPDGSGGDAYPIDPNGPPPDCILPCVWEAMKRCRGPMPGQACVADWASLQRLIQCCPEAPAASEEPVLCGDDTWVHSVGSLSERIFGDGTLCWRRHGEAMHRAPGPPPRAADWTTTWYVPDETTAGETRIATVEHDGPMFPGPVIGKGACYDGEEVAFTAHVDVTAEHCQAWFPKCEVPGICPLPRDLRDPTDAGPHDAAPDVPTSTDAAAGPDATVDASMPSDASRDATQGG
jgi:hypothetical protein